MGSEGEKRTVSVYLTSRDAEGNVHILWGKKSNSPLRSYLDAATDAEIPLGNYGPICGHRKILEYDANGIPIYEDPRHAAIREVKEETKDTVVLYDSDLQLLDVEELIGVVMTVDGTRMSIHENAYFCVIDNVQNIQTDQEELAESQWPTPEDILASSQSFRHPRHITEQRLALIKERYENSPSPIQNTSFAS